MRLDVAGSFTSANDWELRGELTSDSGVRVGDMLTLKRLEGTIKRSGGELGLSFSGEATDIKEIQGFKAKDAKATLSTSDCAVTSEPQPPTKAPRVCLSLDATLEVTLPGASSPLVFKGGLAVDLSTLTFRVTGSLTSTSRSARRSSSSARSRSGPQTPRPRRRPAPTPQPPPARSRPAPPCRSALPPRARSPACR